MIEDGEERHVGGFTGVGAPRIVNELPRQRKSGLTVIASDNAAAEAKLVVSPNVAGMNLYL